MSAWIARLRRDGVRALPGPELGLLARVLLILVGIGPFLPVLLHDVPVLRAVGGLFDAWFQYQCHRESERSFAPFGHLLPVCARCFGIYLGLGLGALVLRPRLGVWPLRIWVGFAALVMVLDIASEGLGMRPASSLVRFVTGILLAYPVGVAVVWAARGEPQPARR